MDEVALVTKHYGGYIAFLIAADERLEAQKVAIAAFREVGVV